MFACPACGASAPTGSTWCGQCYTVFGPAVRDAPVAAAVAAPQQAAVVAPLPGRALALTVGAIAVGAVALGVSYLLAQDPGIAPATYLRYALVLTLGVYAVVGVLVVTQVTPGVRLRWSDGNPVVGVAIGLLVGAGLSGLLLLAVSSATGHLDPDPRVVLLMSEGDGPHIIAAILITCVAAPLVEEVLFRGILLESQRRRGAAAAIWLSAAAFAVWHLTPSALRYYALLGALLGWLYTRRGLACSMAAHVGFNGLLTVAALAVVLGSGPSAAVGGLSAQLPSGWRAASPSDLPPSLTASASAATFRGPSGSTLVLVAVPTPSAPTVDEVYDRLSGAGLLSIAAGHTALHELRLPVGSAIEVVAKVKGDDAVMVFLPHAGRSYEVLLHGAGSVRARADFDRVLRSLRLQ